MKFKTDYLFDLAVSIRQEMGLEDDFSALEGVGMWASETARQNYPNLESVEAEIRELASQDIDNLENF